MTDNEIIKALECCKAHAYMCERDCPLFIEDECGTILPTEALDLIKRQQAENTDLFYKLSGVMLSVDKWLEGDELKQDEVNRAATMREKTLCIVEKKQAEIERLQKDKADIIDAVEYRINQAKEFAYKKFAEQLQDMLGDPFLREHNDVCVVIDNLLAELTPTTLTKLDHSSLCETETYEGVTDTNVGGKKNDFKEVV